MSAALESARIPAALVAESDYALRYGTLCARVDQLAAVLDETLSQVVMPPRLRARLVAALEAAKKASGL